MQKDYQQLSESIRQRINPENISFQKAFTEEFTGISYSKVLTFVRLAMKSVEPEYTQKSKTAGERVKSHLIDGGVTNATFEYQGSVMTNTHIKGHSDIDLLTICDKFYSYDLLGIHSVLNSSEGRQRYFSSQIQRLEKEITTENYNGNSLQDLRELRLKNEDVLTDVYSVCDVSKPKSIKIVNTSLSRDVDIVVANWYDDITSIINNKGIYRGLQVYNKHLHQKGKLDFPFLSIKRINDKSLLTGGRLKKMIRFLKNIKVSSEKDIDLSSFDINAICYDIPENKYKDLVFHQLVGVLYEQLTRLSLDVGFAERLMSVDGREPIFKGKTQKHQNLKLLLGEVEQVFKDLNQVYLYD